MESFYNVVQSKKLVMMMMTMMILLVVVRGGVTGRIMKLTCSWMDEK